MTGVQDALRRHCIFRILAITLPYKQSYSSLLAQVTSAVSLSTRSYMLLTMSFFSEKLKAALRVMVRDMAIMTSEMSQPFQLTSTDHQRNTHCLCVTQDS